MNSASEAEDETWTQDTIEGDSTDGDDSDTGQQRVVQLPNGQKFECDVVVQATNLTSDKDNRRVGVARTENGDIIWFDGKTSKALTGSECNDLRAYLCEAEDAGHKVTPAAVCNLSDITEPTPTDYILHNELEYTSCTELMAYDEQQKLAGEERATKKPKVAAVQKSAAKKPKETKAKADPKKGKKPAARKKADGATDSAKSSAPKAVSKRKAEPAAAPTTTAAPQTVTKIKTEPEAESATTVAKPAAKRKAAGSKAASASKRGKMTWRVEITGDNADDISHFFANAAKSFAA